MAAEVISLNYKGRPLRRKENMVYYGSMSDSHIVLLQVLDAEPLEDISLAKRVSIQLQLTDSNVKTRDLVVKRSEKNSFYEALDIASVWLERALSAR